MLPIFKEKNTPQWPGRITMVGSETAAWCKFKEQDSSEILTAFNDPKVVWHAGSLRYVEAPGAALSSKALKSDPSTSVVVDMANPGLNYGSNLLHEIGGVLGILSNGVKRVIGRNISVGARTLTDAAVDHGSEVHGKYLGDSQIKP